MGKKYYNYVWVAVLPIQNCLLQATSCSSWTPLKFINWHENRHLYKPVKCLVGVLSRLWRTEIITLLCIYLVSVCMYKLRWVLMTLDKSELNKHQVSLTGKALLCHSPLVTCRLALLCIQGHVLWSKAHCRAAHLCHNHESYKFWTVNPIAET
jgi:hypothetical protein